MDQKVFLDKIRVAGYDGFDTWGPENVILKKQLFDYLQRHEMYIVTHQHKANGNTFKEFKLSFLKNLSICAEPELVLINSHIFSKKLIGVLCYLLIFVCHSFAQLKEPYKLVHNGSYSGFAVKESPDPLITYRWNNPKASDSLEIYALQPKKVTGIPHSSFSP